MGVGSALGRGAVMVSWRSFLVSYLFKLVNICDKKEGQLSVGSLWCPYMRLFSCICTRGIQVFCFVMKTR